MADASIKKPNWAEKKWAKIRSNGWALNLIYFLLIYHAVVIIAIGFGSSFAREMLHLEVDFIRDLFVGIVLFLLNGINNFFANFGNF